MLFASDTCLILTSDYCFSPLFVHSWEEYHILVHDWPPPLRFLLVFIIEIASKLAKYINLSMQWHLSDYSEGLQEYRYIQAILPWVPRLRAIGLLHKEANPPWFDFQKRYFSGATVWTTNATSSNTFKTVGLVRRTIGSTAMRSLFRTQARVRHFLSFLWISRLPESRRVCTRLLLAPSRSMNQLVHLHLRLFPRWTSSGRQFCRQGLTLCTGIQC